MNDKRFVLDDEENGLCRCILVDGEEIPTCFDVDLFYNIMVSRIQSGLVESMKYENGAIKYKII